MRISEAAAEAHVNIQTVRYYERRGLIPAPRRQPSGYRRYEVQEVQRIRFIRRAQVLGFTLAEIGDLLALWPHSGKSCAQVEGRARVTLQRIDGKIKDLRTMRTALASYVTVCESRRSLERCPLLHALGGAEESADSMNTKTRGRSK